MSHFTEQRHIEFVVWAMDGGQEISKGSQAPAVIETASFLQRLVAKR